MAKKVSPPSYCLHKATGQAYTRVNGRMIYLGTYDSAESRTKWAQIAADWSAGNLEKYGQTVSIARLCVAYTSHAEEYYRKNGKLTSHIFRVRSALRLLVEHFGNLQADKFTPNHMERLQAKFVEAGLARKTITEYMNVVRQTFQFGVTKGNVPPAVWQGLLAVRHLRKGRTVAKESKPVPPVSPFVVIRTARELGRVTASMVRLQYVTGMRPGEVCLMRLCDIDRSGDVWKYTPQQHKTEHHDRPRSILLGRKAQRILQPFLNRSEESFIFSPNETLEPATECVVGRLHYTDCYSSLSYCRAVYRAAKRAGVERWSPNQLRHTYATCIRKRCGLEAAQILLGHSRADVTQIYAERDLRTAEQVVREVG